MTDLKSWAVVLSIGGLLAAFPLNAGSVGPAHSGRASPPGVLHAAARSFQVEDLRLRSRGNTKGFQFAKPASSGQLKQDFRVKVTQAESVPRSVSVPEGTAGELPLLLSGLVGLWFWRRRSALRVSTRRTA